METIDKVPLTLDRLIEAFNERFEEMPQEANYANDAYNGLALAGEVGEYCNFVKKRLRGDLDLPLTLKEHKAYDIMGIALEDRMEFRRLEHSAKEARELADCILYIGKICSQQNINLEQFVVEKWDKYATKINSKIQL